MKSTEQKEQWLVSEITLRYRPRVKPSELLFLETSQQAFEILISRWNMDLINLQEQFRVIYVNRANRAIGSLLLSAGTTSSAAADPKLIFAGAIKAAASGIILAHNHPSGILVPSEADITLTRKLVQAGRFLDIKILDHLIISADKYYSFADQELL